MLDRRDATGRERPAVPDPLHDVHKRNGRIAWPDEVRVQRMHVPVGRHRPSGRHQRLSCYLTAEHALPPFARRAAAAEDIHLYLLEVEQADDGVQRLAHGALLARSSAWTWLEPDGVDTEASPLTNASHSSSTAAPYRSSLTAPTPGRVASCARVTGRVSLIAWSVASEKTTYAGTACSLDIASRQSRSRWKSGSSELGWPARPVS